MPQLAPDVAVEILSPKDRRVDIDDKIATYLSSGSSLVIAVDPAARRVELHDPSALRILGEADVLTHSAIVAFELSLNDPFKTIDPPR